MPTNINTNFLSFENLVSRLAPDAKVLPIVGIDFTVDVTFNLDLTATVQSAQLANPIQGAFIDCSSVAFGVTTLQVFGTGQVIKVPPGRQGYYPLLIPANNFVFILQNTGNKGQTSGTANVNIFFVTIPVVASEWSTSVTSDGGSSMSSGPVRSVAAGAGSDTATIADYTILVDTSGGTITEYLPTNLAGLMLILNLIKTDASNSSLIVHGNGNLINKQTTFLLDSPGAVTVQWTGNGWQVISSSNGWQGQGQAAVELWDRRNAPLAQSRWQLFAQNNSGNSFGIYDVANAGYRLGFAPDGTVNILGAGWKSYTPTVAVGAGSLSGVTATGVYLILGSVCMLQVSISGIVSAAGVGSIYFTLPVNVYGGSSGWILSEQVLPGGGSWQTGWGGCGYPDSSHGNVQLNGGNFPLGNFQAFATGLYRIAQ